MTTSNAFGWYETSLPDRERKLRGHFSTPPHLVEMILDACGYLPTRDLSFLRVLDPACGSGNFLLGAAQRLLSFAHLRGLDGNASVRLLQHAIWGFDPDPVACFLATMQLHQLFARTYNTLYPMPGNRTTQQQRAATTRFLRHLHIHQADGLTFPWENQPNVDLFLANPPYLAAKNNDLTGYQAAGARGQSDSYLLFLELALRIVRPGGWIALILPDPVLARANATQARKRLLAETTVHHLWHLANVFAASVGAVVLIAQKIPPHSQHVIQWQRGRWLHATSMNIKKTQSTASTFIPAIKTTLTGSVSQQLLYNQSGAEMRYLLSDAYGTLAERLHACISKQKSMAAPSALVPLDAFVRIRRGEEIGKANANLLSVPPPAGASSYYPVLRGGIDIGPYCVPVARRWIAHNAIGKALPRYLSPKILVTKSVEHLCATLDLHQHVVLQTLYLLELQASPSPLWQQYTGNPRQIEDELYFLLALLNSRLLHDYVYILYTAYKWVQPQIEQYVLAQLPVPVIATSAEKTRIVRLARLLMHTCSKSPSHVKLQEQDSTTYNVLYEQLEQAICALYTRAMYYES